MQLAGGAVLYQMHVAGFASDSPPERRRNLRFYQNPTMESAAVLAGTLRPRLARLRRRRHDRLRRDAREQAALAAWGWLLGAGQRRDGEGLGGGGDVPRRLRAAPRRASYVDALLSVELGGPLLQRRALRHPRRARVRPDAGRHAAVVANMRERRPRR